MTTKLNLIICFILVAICSNGQTKSEIKKILLSEGEQVWAGVINDGQLMPFSSDYSMDFYANNKNNQLQPLILTNKGQFVWSEKPFRFELKGNEISITDSYNQIVSGKVGSTLAEVQAYVRQKYFPASGKMPDSLLFARPQYNTWIELSYNQNQIDILKYVCENNVNDLIDYLYLIIEQEDIDLLKYVILINNIKNYTNIIFIFNNTL